MRGATVGTLALALALSACSYQLWVEVDGKFASPRFSVNAPKIMDPTVCFQRIVVTPAASPDQVLWEVKAVGDQCAPAAEIFYGTVPAGFEESRPAQVLQADVLYQAFAASDAAGGQIKFVFLNGEWRTVIP